jgi:radical SAM-linked protein
MPASYELTFEKRGAVSFLGHLDLQSVFQKAVRRAGLPVAYSQGFNPHQLISFAMPLPIGMDGLREYVDIDFTEELDGRYLAGALNGTLPKGLRVTGAAVRGGKASAARVVGAEYDVWLEGWPAGPLGEAVAGALAADSLVVLKKTKSGESEADIRRDILALGVAETESGAEVAMTVSAGGGGNLKPSVVVGYLAKSIGADPLRARYTRRALILRD